MIKEMRDVEQRLGKPDPSEDTQAKQKQIIKRIETMIEQVEQSGSLSGKAHDAVVGSSRAISRASRRAIRPGRMAQGAGPMKPAKPTSQHSTAGGKDIWGHLPASCARRWKTASRRVELGSKSGDDRAGTSSPSARESSIREE